RERLRKKERKEGKKEGRKKEGCKGHSLTEFSISHLPGRGEWGREDRSQQAHHAVHRCCHQSKPES
uniref:Uncharacterized protein n=1 Tax=Spermophilus dauricus TaxID=99837 RepID=A0A8C9Q7M2_SPEDA